jgi:hypothetical protein
MDNEVQSNEPTVKNEDILQIETYMTEKVTLKNGEHFHRIHLHQQHKIAMYFKVQAPDELIPRNIQINFCPICGMCWWVELRGRPG